MRETFVTLWVSQNKVTQGDTGGNIYNFVCDNMGHCEEKSLYEHVSTYERLERYSCYNLQIKETL